MLLLFLFCFYSHVSYIKLTTFGISILRYYLTLNNIKFQCIALRKKWLPKKPIIQFLAQPISFPGFSITKPLQDNKKSILKTLLSYLTLSYTKFGCMALRKKWLAMEPHSLRSISGSTSFFPWIYYNY